ncbi:hypothetical protein [Akkermansia glycaniphila]|uniref:Uncharacterized protein n=1 Tax=Akkermansia glycaniphila TaxID=1679444 RepID=A0A1C7PC33_9BACT|nr:hypothetical protein [Akkermansia glycaniphila]OCA03140.1 hypothetical protein AC781_06330 [Akkermansia glycaniphila]SEH96357.1 Hypothetical protein PYTT_2129 [Akkermansia glycaniphila]
MLTVSQIEAAYPPQGLFPRSAERTEDLLDADAPSTGYRHFPWLLSPAPLELEKPLIRQLQGLGHILAKFQDACHELYHRSAAGETHPWIAKMLDAGKPDWLVAAQRSRRLRQTAPRIIRPDLMLTDGGFAITELDSVPGGQGITAWLSALYAGDGYSILGGATGMIDGFRAAHPGGAHFLISEESSDYLPETNLFAAMLGDGYTVGRAETADAAALQGKTVYRFFELFDTDNIPPSRDLIDHAAQGRLSLSPPPIQHLEEKAWLALFHMPGLQSTWKTLLRGSHYDRLREIIPHGWLLDPAPLPEQAALPWLNLHSWMEVARLSQKERRLVLKISGFDPTSWGGRGVHIGHDMPSPEWQAAIERALADYPEKLWIMQEFHPGRIIEHWHYRQDEGDPRASLMPGRVRLCPYYYRHADGNTVLGGCLATIVPADKKKIHGMRDAILVPCTPA